MQMKLQNYIVPLFVSTNLLAQSNEELFPDLSFGITHSTYTSICLKSQGSRTFSNNEKHLLQHTSKIMETQYGFGIGLFLWMPLNEGIIFKPKLEGCFSNSCSKQNASIYATSFDLSVTHGFVIPLKKPDKEGVIYLARNMSCYLQSKQPYILIGPKINLKKYDKGYIRKGFENELTFGLMIGYGINYIFQGKNFAPEIYYTFSSTSQNKINDSKKITHSISLAVNFF
jgi:hypothetical protein